MQNNCAFPGSQFSTILPNNDLEARILEIGTTSAFTNLLQDESVDAEFLIRLEAA